MWRWEHMSHLESWYTHCMHTVFHQIQARVSNYTRVNLPIQINRFNRFIVYTKLDTKQLKSQNKDYLEGNENTRSTERPWCLRIVVMLCYVIVLIWALSRFEPGWLTMKSLPRLPKSPGQCFLNGPGKFDSLGSNKKKYSPISLSLPVFLAVSYFSWNNFLITKMTWKCSLICGPECPGMILKKNILITKIDVLD